MKTINIITTFLLVLLFNNFAMAQQRQANILILIHSDEGGTYEMAKEIAQGIESEGIAKATIKKVKTTDNPKLKNIPVASVEELSSYDGIAFGSPVYFGNISTAMNEFIAKTTTIWSQHGLEGMPATVFMSSGSGAGRELALQSFWNILAVHGMILVSNGIRGYENIDKTIPQGNTVLGTTSLTSLKNVERPTKGERYLAGLQGKNFAKIAHALQDTFPKNKIPQTAITKKEIDVNLLLKEKNITLPQVPQPAGNYKPFVRSGNLVFINQYALKDGKILNPGKVGKDITEEQIKEATRTTMLNVISVLNQAVGGDLNKVKQCVQLTGIFNTVENYSKHAELMNAASDLTGEIFGEKGKHARATLGAYSVPGNSSVEIQAIFEIE
ncbi:Atu1372/SO_1960 family protein [Chryseobacterium indologenes]|uniref:Atu1372/SO_1960 family protein n=1 Tax=Chryseobacterium indologenes TaxID=253 RepID=UPI0023E75EF6|nr:Atu1372/SO_1960 family protein [Chryseobacterium indologenes]WET50860.1 Atu1372/SO_1960 family protein [Chryseobacterium indologenes]